MINFKNVKKFCCDDISLIENYDNAINDKEKTWDCHHRLEIDMNLSYKELIKRDLYYNRPASELMFLTHGEHTKLHLKYNPMSLSGKNNPMFGKKSEDYMTPEAIKEKRKKQSKGVMGKRNGRYHTKQMYKDGEYQTVKYEHIEEYLANGWIIKGKSWYESK